MFKFRRTKYFFTQEENQNILACIRANEKDTSGEIRVFIESKCSYINSYDRAKELFLKYQMYQTSHRNAILIYIAYRDKQFAFCGDEQIFEKTQQKFWDHLSKNLATRFAQKKHEKGLIECIDEIGKALQTHFPFHGDKKNDLPDEIIFGK